MEKVDEIYPWCHVDRRSTITHRSRLRDLSDEMSRYRPKLVSAMRERLCLRSCTVRQLTGWLWKLRDDRNYFVTHSPAGDVDSSTRATSRMDTSKDKKIIESCCIVFQLKVSQKMELQAEKFGLTCSCLRYKRCRTKILASNVENVQTLQVFH